MKSKEHILFVVCTNYTVPSVIVSYLSTKHSVCFKLVLEMSRCLKCKGPALLLAAEL